MKARMRLDETARADYYEEVFRDAAGDIIAQVMASVFFTLSVQYGWKKKRLEQFVSALHDTDRMMWKRSPLQKYTLSPIECEKAIKDDYGIDLRKEFPPKVDMRSYRR